MASGISRLFPLLPTGQPICYTGNVLKVVLPVSWRMEPFQHDLLCFEASAGCWAKWMQGKLVAAWFHLEQSQSPEKIMRKKMLNATDR